MPALIFLKRKWLIACDDFAIPFTIEAFIRIYWCITLSTLLWLKLNDCVESLHNSCFLYISLVELMLTACLSFVIAIISAKGSVLEVEKRKYVPRLLFIKVTTIFCDIAISSYGTWLFLNSEDTCKTQDIFIKITTVAGWMYSLIVLIGIVVCYDALGSPKYWDFVANSNSLNFFKKVQYMWRLRLKCFCCCADISEENDLIYVEISTFLASFLHGIDLVPTDILTGIITLSQKHVLERRKYMLKHMPESLEMLDHTAVPDWMTVRNALHFLRIAKSTYGWMAFLSVLRPWNLCLLSPYARCNVCCFANNSSKRDNCCYLNSAAARRISQFRDSDILYASFENCIHEPAFYVAADHEFRSVVIAVRGTGSFSDILTDIDAEVQPFPSESHPRFHCHRGALRSALFVQKRLETLNVLEKAFQDNPSYSLALTGHSLGGSIASLLAVLLRPKFPDLQCYSYGTMAGISAAGVEETLGIVLSVVVGEDVAPRLCVASCLELRKQIIRSLGESKDPKYKILLHACWYHIQKYFTVPRRRPTAEGHENVVFTPDEEGASHSGNSNLENSKLYAPGRILYFEKNKWSSPYWLTGLNLQNIIVNPDMITDHQPHKIQRYLERYMESLSEEPHVMVV